MNRTLLKVRLVAKERDCRYPYDDATGKRPVLPTGGKLTIGVGRNLEAKPLSDAVVALMLNEDIDEAEAACRKRFAWYDALDDTRQRVVVEMMFNLGETRLLKFKQTLAYLAAGMYGAASDAMLDSKWATQVGKRANELAEMMKTGKG